MEGKKKGRVNKSLAKKLLDGSPVKSYTQPSLVLDKSMSANPGKEIADAAIDKVEADKKKQNELYAGFDGPIAMKYSGDSPAMRKLSASCKAAARAKFDTYPSAYANMWASKQQGKGKC
jgi:hypothetical protein